MEWINVRDRVPEDYSSVLLMVKFTNKESKHVRKEMFLGWFDARAKEWITNYFYGYKYFYESERELRETHTVEVTHWMPLPELQKGE